MINYFKNERGYVEISSWETNCWVNVQNSDIRDKTILIKDYGVPESFLNDIEDIDERPRIEFEDEWTFIILRLPYKSSDDTVPYSSIPMGIIYKDDIFISVCCFQTDVIPDFINYTMRKNIQINHNFDLVLRMLFSSSVWFLKYLKQINFEIKLAEKKLEKSIRNEELQALLTLEKCLVFFNTSLKGNDILIKKIKNMKYLQDLIDYELIEDVEIELRQAHESTMIYSDILSGMMDAYASVISNNLNVIMKQLTSISIILMIPTLIASLYGMNVHNNLENTSYGFWLILIISFLLSAIGVLLFKRKNWF